MRDTSSRVRNRSRRLSVLRIAARSTGLSACYPSPHGEAEDSRKITNDLAGCTISSPHDDAFTRRDFLILGSLAGAHVSNEPLDLTSADLSHPLVPEERQDVMLQPSESVSLRPILHRFALTDAPLNETTLRFRTGSTSWATVISLRFLWRSPAGSSPVAADARRRRACRRASSTVRGPNRPTVMNRRGADLPPLSAR